GYAARCVTSFFAPIRLPDRLRKRVVIVREGRLRVRRWRILLQQIQNHLHRPLELRVVAFAHQLRVHHDFDIGRDAVVLHLPFTLQAVNRITRGRYVASIEERGIAADADEPSPGSLAHDWADAELAEIPGQGIAPRARKLIDDHHLGTVDGARR